MPQTYLATIEPTTVLERFTTFYENDLNRVTEVEILNYQDLYEDWESHIAFVRTDLNGTKSYDENGNELAFSEFQSPRAPIDAQRFDEAVPFGFERPFQPLSETQVDSIDNIESIDVIEIRPQIYAIYGEDAVLIYDAANYRRIAIETENGTPTRQTSETFRMHTNGFLAPEVKENIVWETVGNARLARTERKTYLTYDAFGKKAAPRQQARQAMVSEDDDVDVSNHLAIFPNPTAGKLTISSQKTIEEIVVFDATGKVADRFVANSDTYTMNTDGYASGLYVVQAITTSGTLTSKFIKN